MACSAWIQTLAIWLDFSTSFWFNWSFYFVKAGITSVALWFAVPSATRKRLSANTWSSHSRRSRKPLLCVITSSDTCLLQALNRNVIAPIGVILIKTFRVLWYFYFDQVNCLAVKITGEVNEDICSISNHFISWETFLKDLWKCSYYIPLIWPMNKPF